MSELRMKEWLPSDFVSKMDSLETPCYVYRPELASLQLSKLRKALGTEVVLSLKANECFELLLRLQHEVTDIEVASLGELNLAVQTNRRIFVTNPSANSLFLKSAVASRATVIVDHVDQVRTLAGIVPSEKVRPLVFRLNGSALTRFRPGTIRADHFGFDYEGLLGAVRESLNRGFLLGGLHFFGGSNRFYETAWDVAEAVAEVKSSLEKAVGVSIPLVNLGGGFPEGWEHTEFDYCTYRDVLSSRFANVEVLHESGRGIFSNCGAFVVRVMAVKHLNGELIVICDGGLGSNFLLCQTEVRMRKYRRPVVLTKCEKSSAFDGKVRFVGSSCSPSDVLTLLDGLDQTPMVGDLVIFENCGAYCASYSPTKFLLLGEAQQYLFA